MSLILVFDKWAQLFHIAELAIIRSEHAILINSAEQGLKINLSLPNSGGRTVSLFPWMRSSLKRVSSPISFGKDIRSFSRNTNWEK